MRSGVERSVSGEDAGRNILYTAFTDRPKHLDPAQSYAEDEATFTAQIYEPPLQYHYLKRPYELIPLTVERVPVPRFYDAGGRELPQDAPAERIAESVYELKLKPGIRFQPHPAFAPESYGQPENLAKTEIARARSIADFPHTGSRELTADDYIYQIKRLAHPKLHSPIFGMMADKIVGLKELGAALGKAAKDLPKDGWLDLDAYPLAGVEKVDALTWRIRVKGKYPQFAYWLAMPFFAPVPREVDRFYARPGMAEKNLTLDWWPVGTGPFMLTENDPNRRMVLSRNPNFRGETYPCEGEVGDREAACWSIAASRCRCSSRPCSPARRRRFPTGTSSCRAITTLHAFRQTASIRPCASMLVAMALTDEMEKKGIRLLVSVKASTSYMGFNMHDPVSVVLASGRPNCVRRFRSPSIRKNSSPSS
jgi:oligopeptide transport system substrate-binding protein